MDSSSDQPQPPNRPRGFVLLIVLLAVGIMTALLVLQGDSQRSFYVTRARHSQEMNARALAETCIARGEAIAQQLRTSGEPDLDRLLDPNGGLVIDGDEFVPTSGDMPGQTIVYVPAALETETVPLRKGLHRYAFVRVGEGACLLRFDDNSDDGHPLTSYASGTGNTGPLPEGGAELVHRDRDGTIIATAIGLYPVPATRDPRDAYHRAPARVTLKRFISVLAGTSSEPTPAADAGPPVPSEPAIWTAGTLSLNSNDSICGGGGIQANNITSVAAGSCVCGEVRTTSDPPTYAPAADCSAAAYDPGCIPWDDATVDSCEALSTTTGAPDAKVLNVPTIAWNASAAFGPVHTQDVCEFYFWHSATVGNPSGADDVFVWDHTDTANSCHVPVATATLPNPCDWSNVNAVTCGVGQSPCWKLVSRIQRDSTKAGYDVVNQDLQSGAAVVAEHTRRPTALATGELFSPMADKAIPNIADASKNTWDTLCGFGVTTAGTVKTTEHVSTGAISYGLLPFAEGWESPEETMCDNHFPSPAVLAFNLPASMSLWSLRGPAAPELGCTLAKQTPMRWTVLTNANAWFKRDFEICCAHCDCSHAPNPPVCDVHDASKCEAMQDWAIVAGGMCATEASAEQIVGNVMCGSVHFFSVDCVIGSIYSNGRYANEGGLPSVKTVLYPECNYFAAGADCNDLGVCLRKDAKVVPCMDSATGAPEPVAIAAVGDICLNSHLDIGHVVHGDIISREDIAIRGSLIASGVPTIIYGHLKAQKNITFGANLSIISPAAATAAPTDAGPEEDGGPTEGASGLGYLETNW